MDRTHFRRIKRWDKAARWVITLGGLFIIISVIAILFMIARVALPLFLPSRAELLHVQALPVAAAGDALAIGMDDSMQTGFVLLRPGAFQFFDLRQGTPLALERLAPPTAQAHALAGVDDHGNLTYGLLWDDGTLSLEKVVFSPKTTSEGRRTIEHKIERIKVLAASPGRPRPVRSLVRLTEDGKLTQVSLAPEGRFLITQEVTTTNLMGEAASETHNYALGDKLPGPLSAFTLDQAGATLYAGTRNGYLLRWDLSEPEKPVLKDSLRAFADGRPVTALGLVLGDISLAVGDGRGGLSTWFPVSESGHGSGGLTRIHELAAHDSPVTLILPSRKDKTILSVDERGGVHLDHMTSERHLVDLAGSTPVRLAALTGRAGGLIGLDQNRRVLNWAIDNPYPEVSLKSLFGKVWYENYPRPQYAWQSSAGSDDFEPKLSLVPLIYGTFKGTFYALLFAVPLAILGALYTSQFMRPDLRRIIKPAVEVMAAIPSVVLGLLAALWLAPRVEGSVLGVFLSFLLIPLALFVTLLLWQSLENVPLLKRIGRGYEFLLVIPGLLLGVGLALTVGPLIEGHFFGGSFTQWLFSDLAVRYDQRNCIVIAFALGFAVIPIIFTIADDALSNIPRSLTAASLALGASRWQTAWRVILPSASPGIFAGVMIGLGRAVGETMIVLMATGNTPVMDPSPFSGMRTLSANIAVEIPEAPFGGTLYRVLFLTAVILFLMTFVLNTAAELVRQRLRKRYGQL